MIQPGQKLKEGDFTRVNEEQRVYLCRNFKLATTKNIWNVFYSETMNCLINDVLQTSSKKEYTFTDFQQLCENTFGK